MIVCVIDDDEAIRSALVRLLDARGFAARGYASVGDYLLEPPPDGEVGCLLLDVYMPGPSGLDLQRKLGASGRRRPVVFMSGSADVPTCAAAMRAGAIDFLTKPIDRESLFDAVRRALAADAHDADTARARDDLRSRYESLSSRERAVFDAVAAGRLNKQIAAQLGVAERTVKAHRASVMDKLGADTAAALGRIAERLGRSRSQER